MIGSSVEMGLNQCPSVGQMPMDGKAVVQTTSLNNGQSLWSTQYGP